MFGVVLSVYYINAYMNEYTVGLSCNEWNSVASNTTKTSPDLFSVFY